MSEKSSLARLARISTLKCSAETKQSKDNILTNNAVDTESKIPEYKACAVGLMPT
ncbi:MAG: hypothetical protein ABSA11_04130 [Candidatus Bathyarchaeia archaeon]